MSYFINNAITDSGRILLADAQAGAVFTPTKVVIGSGNIPAGSTARTMTAVVTPVATLDINKKERTPDGKVIIGGMFSNEDITAAFYFREFALYAKVKYADGTYSSETLYSYGNAGNSADLIPAYSSTTVVEKQMDLVTYVGNDTAIDLTIESGVYMTREAMDAAIEDAVELALKDAYKTDKTALPNGTTILTWANSCAVNTSRMVIGPTFPADAPGSVNGFLEVFVGVGGRKTVEFTPFGDGASLIGKCLRHIYDSQWTGAWEKDDSLLNNVGYYVDAATGADTNAGTAAAPFATLAKAISLLPKNLNGKTAYISVKSGTYTESNVTIEGFFGGSISISNAADDTGKPLFTKGITVKNCTATISLTRLKCNCSAAITGFAFQQSDNVGMTSCEVEDTGANTGTGIQALSGSALQVTEFAVKNTQLCILAQASEVLLFSATGSNNNVGIRAINGSFVGVTATAMNSVVGFVTESGGRIYAGAQADAPNY